MKTLAQLMIDRALARKYAGRDLDQATSTLIADDIRELLAEKYREDGYKAARAAELTQHSIRAILDGSLPDNTRFTEKQISAYQSKAARRAASA